MRYKATFKIVCGNYPAHKPLNMFDTVYSPATLYRFFAWGNNSWRYFTKKNEHIKALVIFHPKNLTIEVKMDAYYCVLYRDLQFLRDKYPQCLKASKRSMEWLSVMDN